jgi:molybdopterin converting factor small subunit
MARLTLSAPLAGLLADAERVPNSRATVNVEAASWLDLTEQMRVRFPALAERVLNGGCEVRQGFVIVVNDEVVRRLQPTFELGTADEVYVFAAVAGG